MLVENGINIFCIGVFIVAVLWGIDLHLQLTLIAYALYGMVTKHFSTRSTAHIARTFLRFTEDVPSKVITTLDQSVVHF